MATLTPSEPETAAASTVSNCGSTTPQAEKLASLDSALQLIADDETNADSNNELPSKAADRGKFTLGPSSPIEIDVGCGPEVKVEDYDAEQRSRGGSSAAGMSDSQEWEKIDDVEIKVNSADTDDAVNPDDVKEPKPEYEDIIGSGQILKKILVEGAGNSRPTRGSRALVSIVGKLEDGLVVEEYKDIELSVGDIEINQGIDLLLPLMNKGETAEAVVKSRFCYGEQGLPPKIPGDATLKYEIELKDYFDEDLENMAKADRLRLGMRKREKGNFWFARQGYASAVQLYRRALDYLDENPSDEEGSGESLMKVIWEERLKVQNNLAAAQMKLEAYDAALRSVDCVLRCQPDNVKALFRKGKIHAARGETEEGLKVLKRATELSPDDKAIAVEYKKLLAKRKVEGEQDRNLYRKMFKEVSSSTLPKQSQPTQKSGFLGSSWKVAISGCLVAGLAFAMYKFKHLA